ncbi:MAG: putative rane protein [Microbacterium sp.]|nr:putative rane protein [Microbacterium sp.]
MSDQHTQHALGRPTGAFVGASWVALGLGASVYFVGLYNAQMTLAEKGFYLAVFLLGLFAAISVQKAVRDRAEDVPVTGAYLGVAWGMLLAALTLMAVGLWNAELLLSEKGFYGIGFAMSLFAVVAVQKNVRDLAAYRTVHPEPVATERSSFASPQG